MANRFKINNFISSRRPRFFYLMLSFLCFSVITFSVFIFSGCSMLLGPESAVKIGVENPSEKNQDVSGETSQDTAGLEGGKTELPQIDYRSATVGAEMVGAIPSFLCTNRDNFITIKITNTGDFPWRTERPGVVRIGYHYYGQDVDFVDYDGTSRSTLPGVVNPGETVTVLVLINNITNPGNYVIQLDPVIEGNENPENNFWFSSKGVKMIEGLVHFDECAK
ncbi:MAG: hypothetical protein BWY60_00829 [Actinobacteria bacterium ADurb.Bin346]|nr:MAG: hypothetical protein BWY60_00829 [Actinobacteria bacterium ADurb.Bin346]